MTTVLSESRYAKFSTLCLLFVLALGGVPRSSAQVAGSASLSGTVRDQAGAQIAGASIVLTEVARNLGRNLFQGIVSGSGCKWTSYITNLSNRSPVPSIGLGPLER